MRDEKKKREKEQKNIIKFFAVMWVLFIIFVSAIASGGENGTLFTGIEALQRFEFFHWLNPKTWGACLKSSIVYWAAVGLFIIYEEKFKHDASGIEAGSAHWNTTTEEYNIDHSEPFGSEKFSDEPNRPHESEDDSWMEGKKNYNNPKERADGSFVKPVPGSPNMIESATVRLSTADMKTHVNNNVFIVGGAGTGKSRFFIKPNILQMNCSYVVTDPSGELLKSMHNVLKDAEEDITATAKHHHSKNRDNEEDLSITHNQNKLKPKQKNNKKENLETSVQEDKVLNYEESEKAFNQNSNETSELTKNHYNAYEDNTEIKHNENDDSFVDKGEPETNPVESYDEDYSSEYDDDFDIDAFLSGATEQY